MRRREAGAGVAGVADQGSGGRWRGAAARRRAARARGADMAGRARRSLLAAPAGLLLLLGLLWPRGKLKPALLDPASDTISCPYPCNSTTKIYFNYVSNTYITI